MHSILVYDGAYWIGLNDFTVEGTFVWTDGTEPSYLDWNSADPSNGPTEDCVRLGQRDWWDTSCLLKFPFICEFNITI